MLSCLVLLLLPGQAPSPSLMTTGPRPPTSENAQAPRLPNARSSYASMAPALLKLPPSCQPVASQLVMWKVEVALEELWASAPDGALTCSAPRCPRAGTCWTCCAAAGGRRWSKRPAGCRYSLVTRGEGGAPRQHSTAGLSAADACKRVLLLWHSCRTSVEHCGLPLRHIIHWAGLAAGGAESAPLPPPQWVLAPGQQAEYSTPGGKRIIRLPSDMVGQSEGATP